MLIVDGHESRCTLEFIDFCVKNKIVLLIMPPHNTQLLRPLDVAIFRPLSEAYNILLDDHNRFCRNWLTKDYRAARTVALNNANITSGCRKSGLLPFNPQEVLDRPQGRPSDPPQPLSASADQDQAQS